MTFAAKLIKLMFIIRTESVPLLSEQEPISARNYDLWLVNQYPATKREKCCYGLKLN